MPKCEAIVCFFDDQLRRDQRFDHPQQSVLVVSGHVLQEREVEASQRTRPTGDCSDRQHLLRSLVELLSPSLTSIPDRARNIQLTHWLAIPSRRSMEDLACREQRLQNLLNEEGIALVQLIKCFDELGTHRSRLV